MRSAALLGLALLAVSGLAASQEPLERIAFGSCNHQDRPQPLWPVIVEFRPQLWIWLGDNIYGDSTDLAVLESKWTKQKSHPDYQKLLGTCPVTGIWDDHDYGANDQGRDYPSKAGSQRLLLSFLDVPADDPRWSREGIYGVQVFGPPGRQVAVILLDVRTFRDKPGTGGDILGPAQWAWLEKTLSESSAQIHLIASGSQILPTQHRFEKWADYPAARERLMRLLETLHTATPILLTGDRHRAEISCLERPAPLGPLFEVTSSSLTHSIPGKSQEPNALRRGEVISENNFGTLSIDWEKSEVEMAVRTGTGVPVLKETIGIAGGPTPQKATE